MVNRIDEGQESQVKHLTELSKKKRVSVGLHLELDREIRKASGRRAVRRFATVFGLRPSHMDVHKLPLTMPLDEFKKVAAAVEEFAVSRSLPVRNHGVESQAKRTIRTLADTPRGARVASTKKGRRTMSYCDL